jgi:hypothetical protein
MARKEILDLFEKYVAPFRITKGEKFRLKDIDPSDTCGLRLEKAKRPNCSSAALPGSRRSRKCSTPRAAVPC